MALTGHHMTNGHANGSNGVNGSALINGNGTNGGPLTVCVLGAGAAGLCAARHLAERPETFQFDVYEQTGAVGGTWVYTDAIGTDNNGLLVHSSMYRNLRTNIPLQVMEFPDFPCKRELNSFVGHDEVRQYLEDYAESFDLYKNIKFYHQIESIKREANAWQVTIRDVKSGHKTSKQYGAVFVCNGRYAVPKYPDSGAIEHLDSFEGTIVHSHNYREAKDFVGQTVIILGAGPSGVDISLEVAEVAKRVILCHELPQNFVDLPLNLIQAKSTIGSVDGHSVKLKNGSVYEKVDTIIFATGYEYDFTFLDPNCGVKVNSGGRVTGVYLHLVNTSYPSMAIWAIPQRILPFPIYHQQVKMFVKALAGEVTLPEKEDMERDAEKDYQYRLSKGIPERHAHKMPGQFIWDYDDKLSLVGHMSPIRPVTRAIFDALHRIRMKNTRGYKDYQLIVGDDLEFELVSHQ